MKNHNGQDFQRTTWKLSVLSTRGKHFSQVCPMVAPETNGHDFRHWFDKELVKWEKSTPVIKRRIGSITQHINTDTLLG